MENQPFLPDMEVSPPVANESAKDRESFSGSARLRRADRQQMRMLTCSLDDLLPADHPARLIWAAVEQLDVAAFEQPIMVRGSEPGRAATDPRVLIALWLYAAVDGVGSGREIDRLCECHDAYRWLAGGLSLNYHTLNDFRVGHNQALDGLFTQVLSRLIQQDLVQVTRVSQDGLRVRASAGTSSFRTEQTLERLQQEVKEHLEALKRQNDPSFSARQQAKREADARDRQARLHQALQQLPPLREAQKQTNQRKCRVGPQTRVSTTDPDARIMKMPDGGFRPGYNVQLASDVHSRAIVGVSVTNSGSDAHQSEPMRQQVEDRTGMKVHEHLYDGGFVNREMIDEAEAAGVKVYAPVPQHSSGDPHARQKNDTDLVADWRKRMADEEAKTIYRQRASTIETINGDLREHRNLRQFPVRGSPKVRSVALWYALAYNLMRFAPALLAAQNKRG